VFPYVRQEKKKKKKQKEGPEISSNVISCNI